MLTPDVQQVLLAKALLDQENQTTMPQAATAGAGLGALTGLLVGIPVHNLGKAVNRVRGKTPRRFGLGNRMAGLIAGIGTGAATGALLNKIAPQESEAARLLAKVQLGEGLTPRESQQLENQLTAAYSNQMGLRGIA